MQNLILSYVKEKDFKKWVKKYQANAKKEGRSHSVDMWKSQGTSLVVQWLRLHASNTGSMGSIPGLKTKILPAVGVWQKRSQI